ncbi:MAG: alpha/beta fold hydrolase [Elusimicrobia bacterium]|nr:alpha/beta fold hydrolase [Elusimicrobiota bacterium]
MTPSPRGVSLIAALLWAPGAWSQTSPDPVLVAPPAATARRVVDAEARDFQETAEGFHAYIAGKKAGIKNADNLPFLLSHGARTKESILLVHGFSDSPYYVRALADIFYGAGYNVVAILLPGHGTKPEDLLRVRLGQWQTETEAGFRLAARLGGRVSLGGFSTGGGLVLDALAKNDSSRRPVGDLFLFSPAVKIKDARVPPACIAGAMFFKPWKNDNPDAPEDNPYRYKKLAVNGACQVYWLSVEESLRRAALLSKIEDSGVGVFAAQSEADTVVDPGAVAELMRSLRASAAQEFILYPLSAAVHHNSVPRPETNPFYGELAARLKAFLARRQ